MPDMSLIGEAGYSTKGGGRGLGLAIVKKITAKYKNVQHISDYYDNMFTQTITIDKKTAMNNPGKNLREINSFEEPV